MLDHRQLQALQSVAKEGSISRAATRLGWSAPTVDYHIEALEKAVGAPLLIRGSRGSTLTKVGHFMADRADEILALTERALTDTRELSTLQQTKVRFGTFPTAAARLLPSIARDLDRVGIEIEATLAEVTEFGDLLRGRRIDAALSYSIPGLPFGYEREMGVRPVLTDPLLFAVPERHPFAERSVVTRDDILECGAEKWILGATPKDVLDDKIVTMFELAGKPLNVAIRTDDFAVALGLVAAGLGIALIPKLATRNVPRGLRLLPVSDPELARVLALVTPKQPIELQTNSLRHLETAVDNAILKLTDHPL